LRIQHLFWSGEGFRTLAAEYEALSIKRPASESPSQKQQRFNGEPENTRN
jgi:hypothetical protein